MLAAAVEDLYAQLVLQSPDLLADPRLGGKKALRCGRDIKVVAGDLPDIAQLLQLHGRPAPLCLNNIKICLIILFQYRLGPLHYKSGRES